MTYPANASAAKLNATKTQSANISQFKRSLLLEPELVAEPVFEMSHESYRKRTLVRLTKR